MHSATVKYYCKDNHEKLKDLLNIKKHDVMSITGAGGKTTLMFTLAEELKYYYKVLVTTTTKIYVPQKGYNYISKSEDEFQYYNKFNNNGIYVYGSGVNSENKLIGLSLERLKEQIPYFHITLIEADGSKKKPIKGWRDNEPVIISDTTKNIGVISIEVIGKEANEQNVHRLEQFLHITGADKGDKINLNHILKLIFHPNGLFKNAKGSRILFINKVESNENTALAKELINIILKNNNKYIQDIVFGKLK